MKYLNTLLAIVMVMIAETVSAQTQRTTMHSVVVPDFLPVDTAVYRKAIKGEVKRFFYGGKDGLERKLEESHYVFNCQIYLNAFKTKLPNDPQGRNPVIQINYLDENGVLVVKDTITMAAVIQIYDYYNPKYGGRELLLPGDSIETDFCHDDGSYQWRKRIAKPNEMIDTLAGMRLLSLSCGNDVYGYARARQSARIGNPLVTNPSTASGSNDMVFNAGGANGSTARLNIDSLLAISNAHGGGNIIILPAVVSATGGSVIESGNSNATVPQEQGKFNEVDQRTLTDNGYQNVPAGYGYNYGSWCDSYGATQYGYCYGNNWYYCDGRPILGTLLCNLRYLLGWCHETHSSCCQYNGNSSGSTVVVNNYNNNTNNNTVTITNPTDPTNPPTGGPIDPPTGGPVVNTGGPPIDPRQRTAAYGTTPTVPQVRGNATPTPAPVPQSYGSTANSTASSRPVGTSYGTGTPRPAQQQQTVAVQHSPSVQHQTAQTTQTVAQPAPAPVVGPSRASARPMQGSGSVGPR